MKKTISLLTAAAITLTAGAQVLRQPLSITPEPGTVQSFFGTTLTYAGAYSANPDCTLPATLTIDGKLTTQFTNTSPKLQYPLDGEPSGLASYVFMQKPVTTPGTYVIHIPESFLIFPDGSVSAAADITYRIPSPLACTVTPEPDGLIEAGTDAFTITFTGAKSVRLADNAAPDYQGDNDLRPYIDGTELEEKIYLSHSISGATLTLRPLLEINHPSNYWLYLPAGAIEVTYPDGAVKVNTYTEYKYTLPAFPAPTASPAPGRISDASILTEITLTAPKGYKFLDWYAQSSFLPWLTHVTAGGEQQSIEQYTRQAGSVRGTTQITFTLDGGIPAGLSHLRFFVGRSKFNVIKPDGTASGYNNCPFIYDYYIDGTTSAPSLTGDMPSTVTVVTTDGVTLMRDASPEAIGTLSPGIYIINGITTVIP